jgi:hypothetical protein
MPRSPLSSFAVAVLAAGSLSAQRPDADAKAKVTMRFAPAVGAVSHCTLRAETAAENEEIGTMEAKLSLHCERTVVAAKDGVVTLRYRFLRVVGSQVQTRPAGEKQEATYDSDKDKGQPSPQFPDIAEDTMVCKVDARGRIVEVEAPDGMTRQSISPFALNGDPASFVRLFAFELPAAAVAAGDGWSPKWAVGMGEHESFAFQSASKLVAVAAGKAAVEDVATCAAPPDIGRGSTVEAVSAKASASVDVADGSVSALTREMKLTGTAGNAQGAVAMTLRWIVQPAEAPPAKAKGGDEAKRPAPGDGR